ncbi:MAG TPA: hypothetical protein VNM67_03890 [Thermoanaerobaculia bacterium]|nr:hypothetical protein [Thermoanaerobaculia bacterium]
MKGRLIRREALTGAEREAMYRLLAGFFEGVTRERFEADLAEKPWVLLLEDEQGLRGFSTLLLYETFLPGEGACTVVYSGDTIVDPAAWGSVALPRCWIAAVRRLREEHPQGRLWWLLLTSGFRTYRFLPVFWRDFWPRWDAETPPEVQARIDALAEERLGGIYREGIVRFPEPQKLRGELAEVPLGRKLDPHVAFFLERNSGWAEGDELVCLTEIAETNLTPAGRRMWRAGMGLK